MKYDLTSVISSIIKAKGEDIIDRPDEFIRVLEASAPDTKDYVPTIYAALLNGAVMMIAQAKNDDAIGQTNAVKIAIEILINESNADKDMAIEVSVSFATAFGYVFGEEKSEAQLIEDAKAHISKQEYKEAIKLLNTLDAKGNREAAFLLANIYYKGIGTGVSYKKAISYLEKADTPDALNMLARMYVDGNGCTKDYSKAISLWEKAAKLGSYTAEYQLAMIYMNGILGVKADIKKAVAYIKSSASKGFAPAIKALNALPKEHKATNTDEISELEILSNNGDVKATYKLANCYFKGDGVKQNKSIAVELYTKSAKLGHFASMIALITRYTMDSDIVPCWTLAKYWYDEAKSFSKEKLAVIHPDLIKGEELYLKVPKTAKNKRERYEEAAKLGYITAYTEIGKMYKIKAKAIPYLKLAADAGDLEAIELLLPMLEDSEEVDRYTKLQHYINSIR
ncbi:MAG: sel1 repeat family protein [Ruminococcaceae bacterium]|nr:sel1 repeat family protein [Oscillospiraceae bacterium]